MLDMNIFLDSSTKQLFAYSIDGKQPVRCSLISESALWYHNDKEAE